MKSKVAVMLAVVGVLGAGSAAAVVNTRVLRDDASSVQAEPAITDVVAVPATTTVAVALLAAPVSSEAATPQTVPAATATADTVPPVTVSSTQSVFQVGGAGSVTLDTASGRLMVIATAPAEGWEVIESRTEGTHGVKVTFRSGSIEVDFGANNVYGIVGTSVESRDFSIPDGTVYASGGSSDGDEDEDEDEYEGDEDEDDDDEDEYEGDDDDD